MTKYTHPGGNLPQGELAPALLFHKWHAYDTFQGPKAFKREEAAVPFLRKVSGAIDRVNREGYRPWHQRFENACKDLGAEKPVIAETWWRMVVGWATNPALEVGIELDRLLGFPFIPGSAVKGVLHRVAEMELMEGKAIPEAPASLPSAPADALLSSVTRALLVRALFGALSARRDKKEHPDHPEPPIESLRAWHRLVQAARGSEGDPPEPWQAVAVDLAVLCAPAATGGLVTCYDAVPTPETFKQASRVLDADVLAPHPSELPAPGGDSEGPKLVFFPAVRPGVHFEFRLRLAPLPRAETEGRDAEESFRQRALRNSSREGLLGQLEAWLWRGLGEYGLGGKTSAGYGILFPPGKGPLLPPKPGPRKHTPEPAPKVSSPVAPDKQQQTPAESYAEKLLPKDLDPRELGNRIDTALENAAPEELAAVAQRFATEFSDTFEAWQKSPAKKKQERLRSLGLLVEPPIDGGGA